MLEMTMKSLKGRFGSCPAFDGAIERGMARFRRSVKQFSGVVDEPNPPAILLTFGVASLVRSESLRHSHPEARIDLQEEL